MSTVRTSGYAKGEATKAQLLTAALACFSRAPFGEVSTRSIAETAGLNVPAIKYYFEDKQGLYDACAKHVVSLYQTGVMQVEDQSLRSLSGPRDQIKDIFRRLIVLTTDPEFSDAHAGFIFYALQRDDRARTILIEQLWAPGLAYIALLIANIRGRSQADETDRLDAVLLLSSLSAFSTGLPVSLHALDWTKLDKPQVEHIIENVFHLIDRL